MKKIIAYLKNHLLEDFNGGVYLGVGIMLTLSMVYNYQVDFEDSYLDQQTGFIKVLYFFLFFAFPFYTTLFLYATVRKDFSFFTYKFWLLSGVGLMIQAFDSSALYVSDVARIFFPTEQFIWRFKVSNNLLSLFTIILPLVLLSSWLGHKKTAGFGLNKNQFDAKPYFQMLLLMVPVLVIASFLPGFLNQYPMYNSGNSISNYPQPEFLFAGIYELAYGLNFISVELFFRGFLVIGLMSFAGRKVVLAMAASYCFLHFGKPAGEAISSIFGGFILGVIAYETKSIWGGVIIHVGIAWAMEAIASLRHIFG